jgi:hypothetical protein
MQMKKPFEKKKKFEKAQMDFRQINFLSYIQFIERELLECIERLDQSSKSEEEKGEENVPYPVKEFTFSQSQKIHDSVLNGSNEIEEEKKTLFKRNDEFDIKKRTVFSKHSLPFCMGDYKNFYSKTGLDFFRVTFYL